MNDHTSLPESQDALSRRAFLQRVGMLGTIGAGALLAACGTESAESGAETGTEAGAGASAGGPGGFSCDDVSGLTEGERQVREAQAYVDQSPQPDKLCENCLFWQVPQAGAQCGGCQVVKGPIHPQGYCNLWQPKQPAG